MVEIDVRDNTRNHTREATLWFSTDTEAVEYILDAPYPEIEILNVRGKNEEEYGNSDGTGL